MGRQYEASSVGEHEDSDQRARLASTSVLDGESGLIACLVSVLPDRGHCAVIHLEIGLPVTQILFQQVTCQ